MKPISFSQAQQQYAQNKPNGPKYNYFSCDQNTSVYIKIPMNDVNEIPIFNTHNLTHYIKDSNGQSRQMFTDVYCLAEENGAYCPCCEQGNYRSMKAAILVWNFAKNEWQIWKQSFKRVNELKLKFQDPYGSIEKPLYQISNTPVSGKDGKTRSDYSITAVDTNLVQLPADFFNAYNKAIYDDVPKVEEYIKESRTFRAASVEELNTFYKTGTLPFTKPQQSVAQPASAFQQQAPQQSYTLSQPGIPQSSPVPPAPMTPIQAAPNENFNHPVDAFVNDDDLPF